ncbi:tRNA lysidine(34) synthetase TilS [Thalassotalea aquiviva]|uniref:tRNA lysidine(34) synthetase TilS n=1 Tax=Thalassotalea aquiviva TaxID=3242415 RepID=UPI00352BA3DC
MTLSAEQPIEQVLYQFLQSLELTERPIVIAYSGGIDSQVLLHSAVTLLRQKRLKSSLKVIHVNHGLSANADSWQQFCQQQSAQYHVPFSGYKVEIDVHGKESIEALARDARYKVFMEQSEPNAVILTGHHQDDQVETFLLALKRGAGVQGLGAMQSLRRLDNDKNLTLARPLLSLSREQIESYARRQQLAWIEDESNADERFDRNFIRAQVIPLLTQRWPGISQTISRSARHCQQAHKLIRQQASDDLAYCLNEDSSLSIKSLCQIPPNRQPQVLRQFVNEYVGQPPSTKQLEELVTACFDAKVDKNPQIKLAGAIIRRYQSNLYITKAFMDVGGWQWQHQFDQSFTSQSIVLPDGLGRLTLTKVNREAVTLAPNQWQVSLPSIQQQIKLGFEHTNPKCLPAYRNKRRELKKIFQELNVPTWQRKRSPILFFDDRVVSVLPLFVCKEYLIDQNKECLLVSWDQD